MMRLRFLLIVLATGCLSVLAIRDPIDEQFIEVYENESVSPLSSAEDDAAPVDDDAARQPPSLPRWSSFDSTPALNPLDQIPPENYEWGSPWRIDAASSTYIDLFAQPEPSSALASFGWEEGPFHRRRRWVRSIRRRKPTDEPSFVPLHPSSQSEASQLPDAQYSDDDGAGAFSKRRRLPPPPSSDHERPPATLPSSPSFSRVLVKTSPLLPSSSPKGRRLGQTPPPSDLLVRLKEDFLFRGLGISLYKSFLYQYAGGVSLRIPLSPNFLSYYNRPELPAIACSIGLYYPWTLGFFLTASLPAEVVALILHRFSVHLRNLLLRPGDPRRIPVDSIPIKYSQDVTQRVGVSISWRYSPSTGWRCLLAPWALYLPSVRFLLRAIAKFVRRLSAALFRISKARLLASPISSPSTTFSSAAVPPSDRVVAPTKRQTPIFARRINSWLQEKSAGLGLTSTVYGDGMTGSVVLQLSSFFPEVEKLTRAFRLPALQDTRQSKTIT